MSTESEKLNWYSKPSAVMILLLVIVVLAFYIGTGNRNIVESPGIEGNSSLKGEGNNIATTSTDKIGFNDPRNGTYKFDGRSVTLKDGVSESEDPASKSAEIETRIFGEIVSGDISGDGLNDAIFFVSEETGGTGVFFYVVAAVQKEGKYYGTKAVFLGDRIAPQNITINNGEAQVNYAIRKETDPMTAQPSLGVTRYLIVENDELVEILSRKNISEEANPFIAKAQPADNNLSNIVGYFAGSAFFWYVPDWVEQNWNISKSTIENPGLTLSPKIEISNRKFSDIVITVKQSTETYNANALYEKERDSNEGKLIIDEVILNKHRKGMLKITIDTNTRIYHVQKEVGNKIYDRYYIDGSGDKTAYITFSADKEVFSLYETKIREFVEGIGAGVAPQG